ncbi:MAG: protein kinase [Candidatus Aminicenantes bacterium]|nr:protein kinase [Candidatus Aminicenantes bacterium]
MKCPECRSENTDTARFCGNCGTPLMPTPSPDGEAAGTRTYAMPIYDLTIGSVFAGRYQIIDRLGQGGCARVYKALDKELNETIALKLIKTEIGLDETSIKEFREELKMTRRIIHKNVCRMYHFSKHENVYYISMEYVDGEDLDSMIQMTRSFSPEAAISIAKQVCSGLMEAHKVKLVHRDLKPKNIMIDKQGNVRIMDFGIARPIRLLSDTNRDTISGTPSYMSPEQFEGRGVDQRSDIYSLGIILFEMLTGRIPFEGETPLAVGMKHKSEKPVDPRKYNPLVTEDLSRLILKCLEKNKEDRYQSAQEVHEELARIEKILPAAVIPKKIKTKSIPSTPRKSRPRKKYVWAIILPVILAAAAVLVFFGLEYFDRQAPGEGVVTEAQQVTSLPAPRKIASLTDSREAALSAEIRQVTFSGNIVFPAISPDGKLISYVENESFGCILQLQELATGQKLELHRAGHISRVRWLPNGSELSFYSKDGESQGVQYSVSRLGGTPRELEKCWFLAWSPGGEEFAAAWNNSKAILVKNRKTGKKEFIPLDESFSFINDLDWSPQNDLLAVLIQDNQNRNAVWVIGRKTGQKHKIVEDVDPVFCPRWYPDGNGIFFIKGREQARAIWKIPVSNQTGEPAGQPWPILKSLQVGISLDVANDGSALIFQRLYRYGNIWRVKSIGSGVSWTVEKKQLTKGTLMHKFPVVSPDGKMIAFSCGDGTKSNIFVMPAEGGESRQLTFFDSDNMAPAWSPDGKEIAFASNEGGEYHVWKVPAAGGDPFLFSGSNLSGSGYITWAPGKVIIYQKAGNRNFQILDPETKEEMALITDDSAGYAFFAAPSPDGDKIAFFWNHKDKSEKLGVWVKSLQNDSMRLLRQGWMRSLRWSDDAKWIYAWDEKEKNWIFIDPQTGESKPAILITFDLEETKRTIIDEGKPAVLLTDHILTDAVIVENFF